MNDDTLAREQERLMRHMRPGAAAGGRPQPAVPTGAPKRTLCRVCGKPVYSQESVETELGAYHSACFKCAVCGLTLALNSFVRVGDKVYCRRHGAEAQSSAPRATRVTFEPAAPKDFAGAKPRPLPAAPAPAAPSATRVCEGCGQAVRGGEQFATACGGKTWHARCFVCAQCRRPLGDTLFEEGGRPFCSAECVAAATGDVCVRCGRAIADEEYVLLGGDESRPCHTRCYTCEGCGRSFADTDCFDIGGRSLCVDCATKAASASH